MSVTHLNQVELAARWKISPRTLERWRWTGEGLAQLLDEAPWHAGLVGMLVLAERGICRQLQRDPEDAVLRVRAVGGAQRPAPSGMSQMR